MKVVITAGKQLTEKGRRLDASYHASDGVQALNFIRRWAGETAVQPGRIQQRRLPYGQPRLDLLIDVCEPNGIFIGGRVKRIYVNDPDRGVPFLSSSDMLMASFEGAKLISKSQPDLEAMILQPGWTLISRSGTIGNTAYVRDDMAGLAGSEHIMRVVPDLSKIPTGYVYAFLSSKLGKGLLQSGTFGSVVDTISTDFVGNLPIPRLNLATEQRIHELIEQAVSLWSLSQEKIELAQKPFDYLHTDEIKRYFPHNRDFAVVKLSELNGRLGAHYHSGTYLRLEAHARSGSFEELGQLCERIFAPPPFKHIYLSKPNLDKPEPKRADLC